MKVALIRGPLLSPVDLQLYTHAGKPGELVAVGGNWQLYPYPIEWPAGEIRYASCWGSSLQAFGFRGPILWNRLLSWTLGQSFGFNDLEKAIGQADILHSAESFFTMTYQSLEIKRRTGCRLVVTVSENLPHSGETHPIRRQRKQAVLREADMFVAITPTTQRMLLDEGVSQERITIIPNSVDTERFKPGSKDPALLRRLDLKPDDFVVLFIGRFVAEKGLNEMLEAIPRILKSKTDRTIRFCFVGQGPLERQLRETERKFPDSVRIHPFVPHTEIAGFHRLADIFVMLSKPGHKINEQFGFVLAESMATAKPVITTRCGSIPDVVGDTALLIPPANAVSFEIALTELIASPKKRIRMGESARQRILTYFDAEKNARQLESLYKGLLNHP
jgi:starch synthase